MGTGLGHFIPVLAYLGFWVMCIVSLTGRPVLGLYYVMPFLPYRTIRFHFEGYPLASQNVTLLVICVILGAVLKGKRLPPSSLYPVWILFVIYLYISMWLGGLMGNAPLPLWLDDANLVTWKDYLILPMVFFAASMALEDRKQIRTALIIVAISTALVDRGALLESLSHSWAVFDENKRTSGPIAYGPNQLAAFLTQFAMLFWAFARVLKRLKTKILLYMLTGLTVVTMVYAFSRAAYIATLVGIGALSLLKDRKLLIPLTVFLITWQAVVPSAVSERVNMTHNANGQLEASAQERVDLWTQSRDMFMKNPITGVGFGSFQFGEHTDNLKDTHNYYVKVLVETGLIGFLIFAIMLFLMFSASWKLFRTAKLAKDPLYEALGLGVLVLLTSAVVLNGFGDRWSYVEINGLLWVVMGATLRSQVLVNALLKESSGLPKGSAAMGRFAAGSRKPPQMAPQLR